MVAPRFGTDGVRGVADVELTAAFVALLGRAAVAHLGPGPFLVACDTRASGARLGAAFAHGVAEAGGSSVALGVLPTPGLARCAAVDDLPAAMISASHNPFSDNGVKLFAAGGRKLGDAVQSAVQATLDELCDAAGDGGLPAVVPEPVPVDRSEEYLRFVRSTLGDRDLRGLRIVVDCANGAASVVAPRCLAELGAEVTAIHASPDGTNINEACGSTHPEELQRQVVALGADAGLAFDGDADRVLAVDGRGRLVDGDRIIAVCAADRAARGLLPGRTVVVTVMSNLGFRLAMEELGIRVVETAVGDRHVLEVLEEHGWALGGEQSGHVIHRDLTTTGDGLLTGVHLLDVAVRTGTPLADLADRAMHRFPQVLRNVRVVGDRDAVVAAMAARVGEIEGALEGRGRVLIRPSGTEPLVRVMAEAETEELAQGIVDELCVLAVDLAGSGSGAGAGEAPASGP